MMSSHGVLQVLQSGIAPKKMVMFPERDTFFNALHL